MLFIVSIAMKILRATQNKYYSRDNIVYLPFFKVRQAFRQYSFTKITSSHNIFGKYRNEVK